MNLSPRYFSPLLVLILIFVSLSGCSRWSDAEEWGSSGLWSDDGGSILVHKHFFERRRQYDDFSGGYETRNYEVQLYTVPANNLGEVSPLGPRLTGHFKNAHYMHSSGYALIERRGKPKSEGTETKEQIYIDKISADGSVDTIVDQNGITMLGCGDFGGSQTYPGPVDVVLSPDGSLFARFDFNASCSGTTGTITFLNASDLSVNDGPSPLKMDEFNAVDSFFSFEEVWFESGEIFAGFLGGFGARAFTGWKYAPGQEPVRVESVSQECIFSTQPYTNNQGQRVDVSDNGEGAPTISVVDEPALPNQPDCD